MRGWAGRIAVLGLLAAIVGVPVVLRPGEAGVGDGTAARRLVVITPHNEQVRYEFGLAFSRWHRQHFGEPVVIDWRAMGTSDIERQLLAEYAAAGHAPTIGYDVAFGGGDFLFDARIRPVLQPIALDPTFLHAVYPSPTLAGRKLYDPGGAWFGVALSSFGIVYNKQVLGLRGLSVPRSWSDMADPRLDGWVALADPAHSGSVRATYDAIVQAYGFERGWATLRRIGANARYFALDATRVPLDVSAGEAAEGMCIDFFGRYQQSVVGVDRIGYVVPDATAITADPAAVLKGAPHPDLARRFIEFLLSEPGQRLWCERVGERDGPVKYALGRFPIRRDLYTPEAMAHRKQTTDPFTIARPLPPGTPSYFRVMPTVMAAMAIDTHDDLVGAWRAIDREHDPVKRRRMEAVFDALPFTAAQLLAAPARWKRDRDAEDADRRSWAAFFTAQYRRVAAGGNGE